ncbi:Lrp/AsnC ligand binding domain-containing protein [Sulfodiicoccus acidiphilus]|nr:Lrp/AsnC ligand binding domain-containing protein [Sulfodiicoccus acidiphilus]
MASALVLINTDAGGEEEVYNKLRSMTEVTEVYVVYGVYDIVAKVELETMDKLRDFVTNTIRRLPKVRSTLTMIVMEDRSAVRK